MTAETSSEFDPFVSRLGGMKTKRLWRGDEFWTLESDDKYLKPIDVFHLSVSHLLRSERSEWLRATKPASAAAVVSCDLRSSIFESVWEFRRFFRQNWNSGTVF